MQFVSQFVGRFSLTRAAAAAEQFNHQKFFTREQENRNKIQHLFLFLESVKLKLFSSSRTENFPQSVSRVHLRKLFIITNPLTRHVSCVPFDVTTLIFPMEHAINYLTSSQSPFANCGLLFTRVLRLMSFFDGLAQSKDLTFCFTASSFSLSLHTKKKTHIVFARDV